MKRSSQGAALRLVRAPGEFGPILRCFGDLSGATGEALRREFSLLSSIGSPLLTVSLAGCQSVDVGGLLALLHVAGETRRQRSRLVLVAGGDQTARLLSITGIDRLFAVFSSEEVAAAALRSGEPSAAAMASREMIGQLIQSLEAKTIPLEVL